MPDTNRARELREKRDEKFKAAQEILKRDNITAEDEQTVAAIFEEIGDLPADGSRGTGLALQIQNAERAERLGAEFDDEEYKRRLSNRDYKAMRDGDIPTPAENRNAFLAWASHGSEAKGQEGYRKAAEKCGVDYQNPKTTFDLLGGDPETRHAPRTHAELRQMLEARATSDALAVGTAAFGGNTVPDAAMRAMEESLLDYGGIRNSGANVIRTPTGATLPWPTNDDTGNKGAILAENAETTIHTTVFGQANLGAYKYTSRIIRVSIEFLQDNSIGFVGWVGGKVGERISRAQATHYAVGAGSTATTPAGLIGIEGGSTTLSSKLGVTGSTTATVVFTEWLNLIHSVDPAYRRSPNCRHVFNDDTLLKLKTVAITASSTDGRPMWMPSLAGGAPDTVLDYPYTVDQDVSTHTSTGGLRTNGFGDVSKYLIREVMGVDMMRLNERYAEFGQVAFLGFARSDAALTNIDAFKHLIGGTT